MKGIKFAWAGLAAAGFVASALATPAQAAEDGGELIKGLLGSMGVIQDDKPAIDYRERPPLVLPPRMDLREPAVAGSAQARNPQWPNDPDVAARKKRAAEDSKPVTENEERLIQNGNSRLSEQDMRAGRRAGAGIANTPVSPRSDSNWIQPDVLRAQHEQHKLGTAQAPGGETARRSLTEPPTAYRQSASGKPVQSTWEAPDREDEADPKVYFRKQQQRNQQ